MLRGTTTNYEIIQINIKHYNFYWLDQYEG